MSNELIAALAGALEGRLLALQSEYIKLLHGLKQAYPTNTDQETQQAALTIMAVEDQETAAIQTNIQKEMDDLKDHKREAAYIIKKLKKEIKHD